VSEAREAILGRIRAATRDVPRDEPAAWDPAVEPDAAAAFRHGSSAPGDTVERFAERTADYGASVGRIGEEELQDAIGEALRRAGAVRIAVPDDLPDAWLPSGLDLLRTASPEVPDLDAVDGVVTGCAAAIADTGTIVLDAGAHQGPRRLTLVPDLHVCVVRADQIAASVPEAMERLAASIRGGAPITFISGPSATSDIELNRVEGVHGPRTLDVLIVG
jgi:L-lactate dehydrogenase complex protein LldG